MRGRDEPGDPRGRRVHRALRILLLPRWFRERHGAAMAAAFEEARREDRRRGRGRATGAARWARELRDMAVTGIGLRLRGPAPDGGLTTTGRREGTMGLRTVWDDARFAFRGLVRRPAFTLFAAGTVALGVGSATAVFTALEGVVLNPLPFPHADRLVTVWRSTANGRGLITPRPEQVEVWRGLGDVFEELHAYGTGGATLTGRGDPARISLYRAGEGFFDFLGMSPIVGRAFSADERAGEGAPVVVISEALWEQRLGGRRDVLGQALTLDGEPRTIVGVVPSVPNPMGAPTAVDAWAPLGTAADGRTVSTIGRLREGVTVDEADARLDALADGAEEAGLGDPSDWRAKANLVAEFGRAGISSTLQLLMAAVLILLLVACVNVANLLLHRAVRVRRETAVRAALGASRGRLVRQSLLESLFLGLGGGVMGTGLAWALLQGMGLILPERMRLLEGLGMNRQVLLFAVGASVLAAVLFGAVPALRLFGRAWARGIHRDRNGSGPEAGRMRWGLVASEVALSFALVLGATVVVGTLREYQSRDPGFRTEGLWSVSVTLPSWRYEEEPGREAAFRRIADDVARLPGVESVVVNTGIPPDLGALFGRLQPEGGEVEEGTSFLRSAQVDPGFLEVLGQPLLAGRGFRPGDEEDGTHPVVVGTSLAERLFPGAAQQDVVGRRFRTSAEGEYQTVVGVAGDVRVNGLASEMDELLAYFPRSTTYGSHRLAVRTSPGTALDPSLLREVIRAVEPEAFVDVERATAMMAETVGRERFTSGLLSAFAAVALLLSAVGLYGVLSQAVGERTREIGIRMSLGADAGRVRAMVLRGGLGATAVGLVLGGGLALLGMRLAASQLGTLSGMDGAGWTAWATAGLVLGTVALVATWLPARRATLVDPSEAIRAE